MLVDCCNKIKLSRNKHQVQYLGSKNQFIEINLWVATKRNPNDTGSKVLSESEAGKSRLKMDEDRERTCAHRYRQT